MLQKPYDAQELLATMCEVMQAQREPTADVSNLVPKASKCGHGP